MTVRTYEIMWQTQRIKYQLTNKRNSPKSQPLAYRNHKNIGVIKKISLREVCTTDLTHATQKTASE